MGFFENFFGNKKPRKPIGKIVSEFLDEEETTHPAPVSVYDHWTKVNLCNRAGYELSSNSQVSEVDATFAQVQKRPDFNQLAAEHAREIAEEAAEEAREERERLGDAFLELERKWQALSTDGYYLAIFRRGKSVIVDVVELSYVDRNEEKTPFVEIGLTLAKRPKRKDDTVEWEKEITVNAQNVLHFQHLPDDAYPEDVSRYDIYVERGRAFAARFEQQG